MIDIEKPPLEGVYLAHVGIKGMRWGVRKAEPDAASAGSNSSTTPTTTTVGIGQKQPLSTKKKVAIGVAILAGAAATALILNSFGGRQIAGNTILNRGAKVQEAVQGNDGQIRRRLSSGRAAVKKLFQRRPGQQLQLYPAQSMIPQRSSSPLRLYPTQSMFGRARNTRVTDMGDINSSLMGYTDRALRRGGA